VDREHLGDRDEMTEPRVTALDVLVDGFSDNPVMQWVFEEDATRADALRDYLQFWISAYGDNGVLELETGGEGAALWARPGTPALDNDQTAALVAVIHKYNGDRTGLVLGTLGGLQQPAASHWYLNMVAARRGARARGVGARLLEPFLERADREGVPIYLESSNPRNLSFYLRYGFGNLGAALDLPGAGPLLQPMWRPAPADR
jgi:GNAT superfamily N-acetyltransferase